MATDSRRHTHTITWHIQIRLTPIPPPPPGLIGTIGDKGVKSLLDLVMAVKRGEMDRASAINTAMAAFAMDPLDAQTLFPEPAKVDALGGNEPAPAAKPAAKKPKPDTVK